MTILFSHYELQILPKMLKDFKGRGSVDLTFDQMCVRYGMSRVTLQNLLRKLKDYGLMICDYIGRRCIRYFKEELWEFIRRPFAKSMPHSMPGSMPGSMPHSPMEKYPPIHIEKEEEKEEVPTLEDAIADSLVEHPLFVVRTTKGLARKWAKKNPGIAMENLEYLDRELEKIRDRVIKKNLRIWINNTDMGLAQAMQDDLSIGELRWTGDMEYYVKVVLNYLKRPELKNSSLLYLEKNIGLEVDSLCKQWKSNAQRKSYK